MFIAFALTLVHDVLAFYHYVPNGAVASFADGDDTDLPIFLD